MDCGSPDDARADAPAERKLERHGTTRFRLGSAPKPFSKGGSIAATPSSQTRLWRGRDPLIASRHLSRGGWGRAVPAVGCMVVPEEIRFPEMGEDFELKFVDEGAPLQRIQCVDRLRISRGARPWIIEGRAGRGTWRSSGVPSANSCAGPVCASP